MHFSFHRREHCFIRSVGNLKENTHLHFSRSYFTPCVLVSMTVIICWIRENYEGKNLGLQNSITTTIYFFFYNVFCPLFRVLRGLDKNFIRYKITLTLSNKSAWIFFYAVKKHLKTLAAYKRTHAYLYCYSKAFYEQLGYLCFLLTNWFRHQLNSFSK